MTPTPCTACSVLVMDAMNRQPSPRFSDNVRIEIVFCPLHAHAERLREALHEAYLWMQKDTQLRAEKATCDTYTEAVQMVTSALAATTPRPGEG